MKCQPLADAMHTFDNFLGFVAYAKKCATKDEFLRKYGADDWNNDAWYVAQNPADLIHYRDVINALLAQ